MPHSNTILMNRADIDRAGFRDPPADDGAGGSRRTAELGDHLRRDPQRHPRLQTGAGAGAGGERGSGCRSGGESLIGVPHIASFLMTLQRWLSAG